MAKLHICTMECYCLLGVGSGGCSVGGCHYEVRAGRSFFERGNNGTVLFPDCGDYTNVLKLIEIYIHTQKSILLYANNIFF